MFVVGDTAGLVTNTNVLLHSSLLSILLLEEVRLRNELDESWI